MNKQAQKRERKNTLFNLSRYLRVYRNDDDYMRGVMLSGYTSTKDGKRYCNIWIDKDYALKKANDGTFRLTLKIVELTEADKRDEDDDM